MNSSAAEIDLKLRDDFRRYLREYGIEPTLIDPVLAVLFRTLAAQLHTLISDTDRLKAALLDELLEGLGFERRFAHPAQLVVRYTCQGEPTVIGSGTVLTGVPESGGRMSFSTDYGITVSSARIAAVFVYQNSESSAEGQLRLLSGVELPQESLRAGPAYGPYPQASAHTPPFTSPLKISAPRTWRITASFSRQARKPYSSTRNWQVKTGVSHRVKED